MAGKNKNKDNIKKNNKFKYKKNRRRVYVIDI